MKEIEVREEIVEQWGNRELSDPRWDTVVRLGRMSLIAWAALAGPPRGEDLVYVQETARQLNCRSENPRTVLRRLIERAKKEYGWQPTPTVLRAAGMKAPA